MRPFKVKDYSNNHVGISSLTVNALGVRVLNVAYFIVIGADGYPYSKILKKPKNTVITMLEYLLSPSVKLPLTSYFMEIDGSTVKILGIDINIDVKILSAGALRVIGVDGYVYVPLMECSMINEELVLIASDYKYHFYITCDGDVVDNRYRMVIRDENIVSYYVQEDELYFVTEDEKVLQCSSALEKFPLE